MYRIRIITLIATALFPLAMRAQVIDCRKEEPLSIVERLEMAQEFRSWRNNKTLAREELTDYTIPLVFHILTQAAPTQIAVEQAVATLNLAFANSEQFENEDAAATQLSFGLACEAPDGGATAGITYVNSGYRIVDADLEHQDLVNTIKWDPSRYVNIWVVDGIDGEALADYEGRTWWTRSGIGGYASGDGVVVSSMDAGLLAHEIGHYFGLLHTWQGRDCKNDDCLADGDLVCDTPPDRSTSDSCGDNSCRTDTLSNFSNNTFFADTLDMGTNFMDYGNGGCSMDFSLGQAERMQFIIESSYPNLPYELRAVNACPSPCEDEMSIQIEVAQEYPEIGSIDFTSDFVGDLTNFEWYQAAMNTVWSGAASGDLVSTDQNYSGNFDTAGEYSIYLRAWNGADSTCFTSTSVNIRVTCGVVARFSPDKRIIASKQPHALFTDSVTFINRSDGATNYEWIVSHTSFDPAETNLLNDTLSNQDLIYYFREPGNYNISVTASDGTCEDQRGPFLLPVEDPTMDGIPGISSVNCVTPESAVVNFTIFNNGYDTINSVTPVAFYDANPLTSADANFLGGGPLNNIVYGFDSERFSQTINRDLAPSSEIYMVFNATGEEALPIAFPPGDENRLTTETIFPETGFSELTYDNNISSYSFNDETNFNEEVVVCKDVLQTLFLEELVQTEACWDSVLWSSSSQGELGFGVEIDYITSEDDQLDITLVSSSGVRMTGMIDVLASIPEYNVDTVFRIVRGNSASINFMGQGDYSYEWFPQNGLDDPFSGSVNAGPEENTRYTVTIVDEFGCERQQEIQVWVETTAHIPDLFTPNSDGANDRLIIYDLLQVRDVTFRIINKEGVLIYSTTSANELAGNGWDGLKNGQPQPSGSYFWTIEGTYEDGRPVRLNQSQSNAGIVHLVR